VEVTHRCVEFKLCGCARCGEREDANLSWAKEANSP
jgi:hypothetical protein